MEHIKMAKNLNRLKLISLSANEKMTKEISEILGV